MKFTSLFVKLIGVIVISLIALTFLNSFLPYFLMGLFDLSGQSESYFLLFYRLATYALIGTIFVYLLDSCLDDFAAEITKKVLKEIDDELTRAAREDRSHVGGRKQ